MSRFLTHLDVELADEGGNTWVVHAPLIYDSSVAGGIICVPVGFSTDFASVPRIPLAYWLVGDVAHAASVVHDYLYSSGDLSRETADEVFLEAMCVTGVAAWRRYAMYWAVRAFGGANFVGARKN